MKMTSNAENNEEISQTDLSNESALIRAAEISAQISSITLGPNATFQSNSSNKENQANIMNELGTAPKRSSLEKFSPTQSRIVSEKTNKMDINDVRHFQHQLKQQNFDKTIEMEVRKKLEQKRLEEVEKHRKIQESLDKMRLEAERRHKMKMEELNRQIEQELELERRREQLYQEQRKELAANTKKIQEEKERQLREHIQKWEDSFVRQNALFSKLIQSCSPEMASVDSYKKQFQDLKNYKEARKNSLEGIKSTCLKVDALCQSLQKEIIEFKAATERKIAEENERQQIAAAAATADAAAAAAAAAAAQKQHEFITPKPVVFISPQAHDQIDQAQLNDPNSTVSFRQFDEYMQLLAMKRSQIKRFDETRELEQMRFALKIAVNNSVNVLNENNKSTLLDGFQKLFNLLSGQRVNTAKGSVSVSDHNEATDWCKLRIAEKLIDRCDKEPSIVFFTAAIATALWKKFPDFGSIFLALLYKECPFLMPYKPNKLPNQSNKEFLSSWGFRLKNNGECEDHAHYEGRTNKFAALLAAMWISYPRNGETESPFNISHGWRYFAKVLNSPPDTNYLHIIGKLLEISGFMLHKSYGKQFVKIMLIIRDKYIPAVHASVDEETSASFNRLRDTVHTFFSEGKFKEPAASLANGYW